MTEGWEAYAILALVFACAFYVERTDRRIREISARLGRLSLTFLKIENDLDAIQNSLVVLSSYDPDLSEEIEWLRDRRRLQFRHIVENSDSIEEILRGLGRPDPDIDPIFWKEDSIADRMGLPDSWEECRTPDRRP